MRQVVRDADLSKHSLLTEKRKTSTRSLTRLDQDCTYPAWWLETIYVRLECLADPFLQLGGFLSEQD